MWHRDNARNGQENVSQRSEHAGFQGRSISANTLLNDEPTFTSLHLQALRGFVRKHRAFDEISPGQAQHNPASLKVECCAISGWKIAQVISVVTLLFTVVIRDAEMSPNVPRLSALRHRNGPDSRHCHAEMETSEKAASSSIQLGTRS